MTSLTGITTLAAGLTHSVALKDDGTVWSWGGNSYGELGNGNNTESNVPVQAVGLCLVGVGVKELADNVSVTLSPNPTSGVFIIEQRRGRRVAHVGGSCVTPTRLSTDRPVARDQ